MKRIAVLFSVVTIIMGLVFTVPAFAGQTDNVLSENIKEADGTTGQDTNTGSGVKTGHIQDGAVTTPKIADGAVTDAKITGPISSSKISSTGLDADTVDGLHASDLAPVVHTHDQADVNGLIDALNSKSDVTHNHDGIYQKHYNNVIVVSTDGNGDFTDPVAAVNSITDSSATNPYLVRIMPGIYDVGINTVQMKQYVDIEGSGESVTKITGNIDNITTGVINGASNAEIRFVTVENTGGGYNAIGISNDSASPKISHVTILTFNGPNPANAKGIMNRNSSPTISNVTIISSGEFYAYGITNQDASPIINNVTIRAFITTSCVLTGARGIGIYNDHSSTTIRNVSIHASGCGSKCFENVKQTGDTSVEIIDATCIADDQGYGIHNRGDTVSMTNVNLDATMYGVMNSNGGQIIINRSTVKGGTISVESQLSSTTRIGLSQIDGAFGGTGTFNCFGLHDTNFNEVICP